MRPRIDHQGNHRLYVFTNMVIRGINVTKYGSRFTQNERIPPWLLVRIWLRSVVLPAPKKPVNTVTGTLAALAHHREAR